MIQHSSNLMIQHFFIEISPTFEESKLHPKTFGTSQRRPPPIRCGSAAPLLQTTFADLHDRAGRMKAKGVIRDSISWWGALSWVGAMMAT